jgi:hypothetical protein
MMAKFLIKIDRKSVKRNPDAGATSIRVPTYIEISFEIKGKHVQADKKFRKYPIALMSYRFEEGYYMRSPQDGPPVVKKYRIIAGQDDFDLEKLLDRLKSFYKAKLINFNVRYESQQVNLAMPVPTYTYQYKKTMVKCKGCKARFTHDKLETDYDYYGDGSDCYYEDICPKCGEHNCCDIKFENLNYEQLAKIANRKGA